MNSLMIFEGKEVEVFELNGQVLFNPYHCGECLNLGESAVRMAIKKMNQNQVVKLKNPDVKDIDIRKLNNAGENFLTESGVYKLIFKSHKEEAERFQDWVTDEVLPTLRKTGVYTFKKTDTAKLKWLEIMDMNARTRQANMLLKIQQENKHILSKEANQTLLAHSTKLLTGKMLIELPKTEKLYSATEIAEMVGSNKAMVGRVANANNLKIDGVYGVTVMCKSPYSSKEVTCFKYNEFGKEALIKAFNSKNRDGEVVN